METERNKFNKPSQAKGGKDSTKTVLTAAGAAIVGAGAAVGATEWNNESPLPLEPEPPTPDENAQDTTNAQGAQQEQQQQGEQQNQNSAGNQQVGQASQEIQPVDNGQTVDQTMVQQQETPVDTSVQNEESTAQDTPNLEDETTSPIDDVDPDLIAQEITTVEIDPNDVDVADMLTIDNVDTFYFEDGSEMPVALVHTEDDGQYMMVDIDDNMTFDMIFDLEGNPIAQVEGNLTMSDVLDMFDETGDELAYNAEQIEQELAGTDDPVVDIIDTNDLAMVHAVSEEEFDEGFVDDEEDSELTETEPDAEETQDEYEA